MNELPAPVPGLDEPLGLLAACHERILTHCKLLGRIVEHHAHGELGPAVHGACAQVIRYFSTAARHHHEDEEQDLFPLLINKEPALDGLLQRLHTEHGVLDAAWSRLSPMLGEPEKFTTDEFRTRVVAFCTAFENHIALENTELLPVARSLLAVTDLAPLGRSMARRRGVSL